MEFCPASLPACACSAGLVSGYGVVTGGFVAKGWVIAKLLRGGFEGVSVVVTVGIKAPRAQLFCLLSPYGRQVSPRGSTALDLHIYPSLQLLAKSHLPHPAALPLATSM